VPNRILKESICTSDTIDQLTTEEENFFYRLIVNCDDYGRMDGRIKILTAKCYPLKDNSITNDIVKRLIKLIDVGLVVSYVSGGLPYLQIKTWEKHQQIRAKRSKYPEPTSETYNGYQMISDDCICHRNPIQSNPNPIQIRIQSESKTIPEDISSPTLSDKSEMLFEEFWESYPRHINKTKTMKAWNTRRKEGVDPNDLVSASRNYATSRKGKDQQFTQHPSTFLGPAKPYEDYVHYPLDEDKSKLWVKNEPSIQDNITAQWLSMHEEAENNGQA